MPFKNTEAFIGEAIESILQQSYKDWELVAVDDFSEDHSAEIVKGYAQRDARVRYFKNSEQGIIAALELALANSNSHYIGRFDSDDIMAEGRLDKMVSLLEKASPKTIVTGMVQYFSDRPISKGYEKYQQWLNEVNLGREQWTEVYRECVIASPNWLMLRSELLEISGFSGLSYPEDYDWCFRCYQAGFEVECLNSTTLYWREHPNRTSRNSEHYAQNAFFNLKIQRFLEIENFEQLVLWGSGRKARLTASILERNGTSFRWMDMEPAKFPEGIMAKKIEDFRSLKPERGLKLLVGVYPNPSQKKAIDDFLYSRHMNPGEDYWYL